STFEEHAPDWGRVQNHLVDLPQVFDEITPGLYYVHVSTPNYFDADGRALQANGVLNYTHWNIFSKRAESSLAWITAEGQPVEDVSIGLYANDGSFLESGRTDRDGLYFAEK